MKNISKGSIAFVLCVVMVLQSFTLVDGADRDTLYRKYQQVVADVNAKTYEQFHLTLSPQNQFKESDWISVKEFRKFAKDMTSMGITTSTLNPRASAPDSVSKSLIIPKIGESLTITAAFTTQLNADRQQFANCTKISSSINSTTAKWTQTSSTFLFTEASRTAEIIITGKLQITTLTATRQAKALFICSDSGAIS